MVLSRRSALAQVDGTPQKRDFLHLGFRLSEASVPSRFLGIPASDELLVASRIFRACSLDCLSTDMILRMRSRLFLTDAVEVIDRFAQVRLPRPSLAISNLSLTPGQRARISCLVSSAPSIS